MADTLSADSGKRKLIKKSSGVAVATFVSRILGLVRVRLESAVLGGGESASAWFLAFAIPNLLRRVFGEGAFATALMPLVAEYEKTEGRDKVRRQLALVFSVLSLILIGIVGVTTLGCLLVNSFSDSWDIEFFAHRRIKLMFQLLPLLMPYGFFICMAGVVGSVLNYAGFFVLPAMAALLLNIVLLGGLSAAWIWAMPEQQFLPMLAILVPAAGLLQLFWLAVLLKISGYMPDFRNFLQEKAILKRLFFLALPGAVSYGSLQISFLIDRGMAASIGSQAVPALTYVDRIIDIPIGIVAVSVSSVLMAMMTRIATEGKKDEIGESLNFGIRMVWFITLPVAALVIFFHSGVLHLLCLGGKYTMDDLEAARQVAVFYGFGIPFFCSLKIIQPAFYARKRMKEVMTVSILAICLNVVLNYLLMHRLQQGGIALATAISSLVNNLVLLAVLKRQEISCRPPELIASFLRSASAALFSGWLCRLIYDRFMGEWAMSHWSCEFAALLVSGILFLVFFGVLVLLSRAPELREIIGVFRRR